MEEFNIGHHNPKPSSLPQMDLFSNLSAAANSSMDQSAAANFNSSLHHGINIPLSNQGFSDHHHHHHHHAPFSSDEISRSIGPIFDHMSQFFPPAGLNMMPEHHEIMANSSPFVSGTGFLGPGKNYGGNKKRKRMNEREIEKPREVVHVRAKRGQATDSHSLAERLRREKINEKLRCLQDLVPGCYKTMGMAVMLDVIINYVRSLQNQIDFLSMKLSAASLFYDFNSSEAEAIETIQGTSGYEAAQGIEKLVGENYGGISSFQTPNNWPL